MFQWLFNLFKSEKKFNAQNFPVGCKIICDYRKANQFAASTRITGWSDDSRYVEVTVQSLSGRHWIVSAELTNISRQSSIPVSEKYDPKKLNNTKWLDDGSDWWKKAKKKE